MSAEAKTNMDNALNGILSDDYNDLEKVLEELTQAKATATNHGTFKRIDKAIDKVRSKMNTLK